MRELQSLWEKSPAVGKEYILIALLSWFAIAVYCCVTGFSSPATGITCVIMSIVSACAAVVMCSAVAIAYFKDRSDSFTAILKVYYAHELMPIPPVPVRVMADTFVLNGLLNIQQVDDFTADLNQVLDQNPHDAEGIEKVLAAYVDFDGNKTAQDRASRK